MMVPFPPLFNVTDSSNVEVISNNNDIQKLTLALEKLQQELIQCESQLSTLLQQKEQALLDPLLYIEKLALSTSTSFEIDDIVSDSSTLIQPPSETQSVDHPFSFLNQPNEALSPSVSSASFLQPSSPSNKTSSNSPKRLSSITLWEPNITLPYIDLDKYKSAYGEPQEALHPYSFSSSSPIMKRLPNSPISSLVNGKTDIFSTANHSNNGPFVSTHGSYSNAISNISSSSGRRATHLSIEERQIDSLIQKISHLQAITLDKYSTSDPVKSLVHSLVKRPSSNSSSLVLFSPSIVSSPPSSQVAAANSSVASLESFSSSSLSYSSSSTSLAGSMPLSSSQSACISGQSPPKTLISPTPTTGVASISATQSFFDNPSSSSSSSTFTSTSSLSSLASHVGGNGPTSTQFLGHGSPFDIHPALAAVKEQFREFKPTTPLFSPLESPLSYRSTSWSMPTSPAHGLSSSSGSVGGLGELLQGQALTAKQKRESLSPPSLIPKRKRGRPPNIIRRPPWTETELILLRDWSHHHQEDIAHGIYDSILHTLRNRTLSEIRSKLQQLLHEETLLKDEDNNQKFLENV